MTDHDPHLDQALAELDHDMQIAELKDEVARLQAELELETDQADRWSRKATALQAVADAARHMLANSPRFTRALVELAKALAELDAEIAQ